MKPRNTLAHVYTEEKIMKEFLFCLSMMLRLFVIIMFVVGLVMMLRDPSHFFENASKIMSFWLSLLKLAEFLANSSIFK